MSRSSGIIDWLNTCPEITVLDMAQTAADGQGLYKQPAVTIEELIDGSQIRTEHYYILFERDAQIKDDRLDNETIMEGLEDWIFDQNLEGNFPDIGYEVDEVSISNSYYMMARDSDTATYQTTLKIRYYKDTEKREPNHD